MVLYEKFLEAFHTSKCKNYQISSLCEYHSSQLLFIVKAREGQYPRVLRSELLRPEDEETFYGVLQRISVRLHGSKESIESHFVKYDQHHIGRVRKEDFIAGFPVKVRFVTISMRHMLICRFQHSFYAFLLFVCLFFPLEVCVCLLFVAFLVLLRQHNCVTLHLYFR